MNSLSAASASQKILNKEHDLIMQLKKIMNIFVLGLQYKRKTKIMFSFYRWLI